MNGPQSDSDTGWVQPGNAGNAGDLEVRRVRRLADLYRQASTFVVQLEKAGAEGSCIDLAKEIATDFQRALADACQETGLDGEGKPRG
jgi:hypothetical protein